MKLTHEIITEIVFRRIPVTCGMISCLSSHEHVSGKLQSNVSLHDFLFLQAFWQCNNILTWLSKGTIFSFAVEHVTEAHTRTMKSGIILIIASITSYCIQEAIN